MKFFVYGLFDPLRPEEIRYVGAASTEKRPLQHAIEARQRWSRKTHKLNWIRSIEGQYGWKVIRECDSWEETIAAEIEIIAAQRAAGADLTNGTGGGEGVYNPTPEVKAKCAAAISRAHSRPESRKKRSDDLMRRRATAESKAKYMATLSTPEYRSRRRKIAARVNADPAVRAKMLIAHKQSWKDLAVRARRVAGMRAAWVIRKGAAQ